MLFVAHKKTFYEDDGLDKVDRFEYLGYVLQIISRVDEDRVQINFYIYVDCTKKIFLMFILTLQTQQKKIF